MILDANILIYAYNTESIHHIRVKTWLEKLINGRSHDIIIPDTTISAFIRLTSHSRIMQYPLTVQEATATINQLLAHPLIHRVGVTEASWTTFTKLTHNLAITSKLVTDTVLAATALSMSAPLVTNDDDFSIYPGLTVINPLKLDIL